MMSTDDATETSDANVSMRADHPWRAAAPYASMTLALVAIRDVVQPVLRLSRVSGTRLFFLACYLALAVGMAISGVRSARKHDRIAGLVAFALSIGAITVYVQFLMVLARWP